MKIMTGTAPLFFDQTGRFQDLKMLRNGGAADRKLGRQFADRGRPLSKQIENGLAGGVREHAQKLLSVSHALP